LENIFFVSEIKEAKIRQKVFLIHQVKNLIFISEKVKDSPRRQHEDRKENSAIKFNSSSELIVPIRPIRLENVLLSPRLPMSC
jgi:hypothetical protein